MTQYKPHTLSPTTSFTCCVPSRLLPSQPLFVEPVVGLRAREPLPQLGGMTPATRMEPYRMSVQREGVRRRHGGGQTGRVDHEAAHGDGEGHRCVSVPVGACSKMDTVVVRQHKTCAA